MGVLDGEGCLARAAEAVQGGHRGPGPGADGQPGAQLHEQLLPASQLAGARRQLDRQADPLAFARDHGQPVDVPGRDAALQAGDEHVAVRRHARAKTTTGAHISATAKAATGARLGAAGPG